jgi:hypothetical protein
LQEKPPLFKRRFCLLVPSGLIKPLVLPGVGKKALAKRKPQCYDSEGLATASQTKQGGFTRDEK